MRARTILQMEVYALFIKIILSYPPRMQISIWNPQLLEVLSEEGEAGRAALDWWFLPMDVSPFPHFKLQFHSASICEGPLSSYAHSGTAGKKCPWLALSRTGREASADLENGSEILWAGMPGGHSFRLLTLHLIRRDIAVEGPDGGI